MMPPHIPRKRFREGSPDRNEGHPKTQGKATPVTAPPRKATLFDDLDSTASPQSKGKARRPLVESSDDDSSLTSLSDADFEDVPLAKRRKLAEAVVDNEEDEDEDIEFEDVSYPTLAPEQATGLNDGALELTLSHIPQASYTDFSGKKGPSKSERRIRITTHCMHVQFLMFHNAVRNSWLCDPLVQGIMLSHLPPGMWDEIERFRRNSGLETEGEEPKKNVRGGSKSKAKGKGKNAARKPSRDWGNAAERLEKGVVNMSHGDPLFRLLKALSAWWRKRFHITAPGIRKMGYMQTRPCANLIKGFNEGGSDSKRYGERVSNLWWFRLRAQECTGSRDVGAQLFTAILRALGLEARMVANLQPVGLGFNKLEDADAEKDNTTDESKDDPDVSGEQAKVDGIKEAAQKLSKASQRKGTASKQQLRQSGRSSRQKGRKSLKEDSEDSEDNDLGLSNEESEADSIIEIPSLTPAKGTNNQFDRNLEFPHYWTEVLSPATQKFVPVDAIVKNIVGTNRDLIESFEPRGAKADKAKQVMAYVVAFSADGTAKDVTVRYLKRQMLPGRTKGMRMPVEKIPVHNKNGKVKRYDQVDWFRSVLRGYSRGGPDHPLTEVDYDEDATDLKPAQPQKKEVKEGEETLQYYKQSQDFVLERHLKREEALLPEAKPVKAFKNKGKKGEGDGEPVYLRKDVVQVKSEETWHKQGRAPKPGERPMKMVPYRAATTNRRRELAEAEAASGKKLLQGLYSYDQTDWITPPPIENGVIPKNQYGNIDLFVEHMLPEGAAHVPYRGAVRVCRRLEIDFAEAVVDFEFGHRMAVPVIQGVVIAEEYYDNVMEELAKDQAEKARKEDEKRRKAALAMWRKLLMGMRIVDRVRREYGGIKESFQAFGHSRNSEQDVAMDDAASANGEDMAGGFLPEGFEQEQEQEQENGEDRGVLYKSSFFPAVDDDENDGSHDGDGLVIEDGSIGGKMALALPTPQSGESSMAEDSNGRGRTLRRRTGRTGGPLSGEDDDD